MDTRQPKEIIFGEEVRKRILEGVTTTYKAVATTLGSRGRNVAYELNWGAPNVIHDGVTVAKQIVLKNPHANQAAQLIIQAAQKTNDEAGDGTTTATILTWAITEEGIKDVSAGQNPMVLRKGIEKAVTEVVKQLEGMAKPIKTLADMEQVATISAADTKLGKLIAGAVAKVGENGVVTVQDGTGHEVEVEYKEGLEFDKGFISPYLITNQEKFCTEYEGTIEKNNLPFIVIFNDKLTTQDMITMLEPIFDFDQKAKVVIIADDYDDECAYNIVFNRIRVGKNLVAVKSPEFGEHRTQLLNDIAIVTGGKVFGGSSGLPVEQAKIDLMGKAEKIIITKDQSVIIGGQGNKDEIEARKKFLQERINDIAVDHFNRDKFQGRLAKIAGGVAVIKVGAASITEMREVKERVLDAVNATKAAVQHGIVPGGGVALARASLSLTKLIDDLHRQNSKQAVGVAIVKRAITMPLRKLVSNAGSHDPGEVIGKILESTDNELGYNVNTESYENMLKSGIIDPLKVVKTALINAASTASMLLTTECMISFDRDIKTNKEDQSLGIGSFTD